MIGTIVLLILSTGTFIFYLSKQNGTPVAGKSSAQKKQEIINGYLGEMEALLKRCENDKDSSLAEKKRILKRINKELAANIFFDPDEARALLNELARYEGNDSKSLDA